MPQIREVLFSPAVVDKLWLVHGLTQLDVETVIFDPAAEPRWDIDQAHGGRVIIRGSTSGPSPRSVFVALRPVDIDHGIWACITAFVPSDTTYADREDSHE